MSRSWCLALAFPLAATAAHAHGGLAQTMSVAFEPDDDQKIWVGTTFGLLYSPDDGATWYFVCDDALGITGIFDPTYAVSRTGTLFETLSDGLRISRDGGCTWNLAGHGLDGIWTSDVQVAADDGIWIATQSSTQPNDVYLSRDDGVTIQSTGLIRARALWKSLRVAPSDATRVYVTGYQRAEPADAMGAATPLLFRTDSGTAAAGDVIWTEMPWLAGGDPAPMLLGVSRADPDVVFARVREESTDRVFRSADGGMAWTNVLDLINDNATAFLSSADGMTIVIGAFTGSQISRDGGVTWALLEGAPQMRCAGVRPADDDVFACGANWEPDMMAFGRGSPDLSSWTKLFRFVDLDGPLACDDGTPQANECEPTWCTTCDMFGCRDPACGPPPDAAPRDGGTSSPSKPCGCALTREATSANPVILVALAVMATRGAGRRRRP